jgi:4-aminobutyrate aminotransferase/(S)-3-amino-2-methylpropionate transaminase
MSTENLTPLNAIKAPGNKVGQRTQELIAQSQQYEPRSMSEHVPIVWKRGERCYIEDVDGNVFLDMTSGVLVANAGHSHPRLVAAMKDQVGKVVNSYDFVNEYRPELAKKLVEITPDNLDKAFILTTGSEATESAMKLARLYTGRKEIISFQGGFHGRTFGAMSAGGKRSGAATKGFGPFVPGFYQAPFPNAYRPVFGEMTLSCDLEKYPRPWVRKSQSLQTGKTPYCLDYLDWFVETETEGDIAAVIVESYQGGAGSIIPPVEWMQGLSAWCQEHGIVFIADEVQASFGRTGKMFCFEHYGIKPNLVCMGKGISSSVPVAALVGESAIMDTLGAGTMSSTHGGNALSSRIALENIRIIEDEKLSENAAAMGEIMKARFEQFKEKYACLGDARGVGLAWGLEIIDTADVKTKTPDADTTKAIIRSAWERGLLLIAPVGHYGNVLRLAPPLVITAEELNQALDILDEVFTLHNGGGAPSDTIETDEDTTD